MHKAYLGGNTYNPLAGVVGKSFSLCSMDVGSIPRNTGLGVKGVFRGIGFACHTHLFRLNFYSVFNTNLSEL